MTVTTETLSQFGLQTRGDTALELVRANQAAIHDEVRVETLDREFPSYAQLLGKDGVYLTHFHENAAGSFKWRGAVVGMQALLERGATSFIVPSAGNHARGAVWAASQLDMPVTVVVPGSAPHIKREGIRELWHSPKLAIKVVGDTFDEAFSWASEQTSGTLLHPYGDDVIPGQGTVVDDILALRPDVSTIVTPIGGGGLVAGILSRLQELNRTDIHVLGAEAEGSNSMGNSLAAGELAGATRPNLRYGGSAVRLVGATAFEYCRYSPNFTLLPVPDADVASLIDYYDTDRRETHRDRYENLEPTSLVAVAALRQQLHRGTTVIVGTGHNDSLYPTSLKQPYRLGV